MLFSFLVAESLLAFNVQTSMSLILNYWHH